jgi:hypothetical protein
MNRIKACFLVGGIIVFTIGPVAQADEGFTTRDLNPVLLQFYIPTLVPFSDRDGWRIDHNLFVTNTLQNKQKSDEKLTIDVENYRYELGLRYRHDSWLTLVNIPFVENSGGRIDGLIDDWHEFFGLPEGDRGKFPKDDIHIEYLRDGAVEYSQTKSSSGLGDIGFAVGHQPVGAPGYFIGIELPSGSESDYSGNEAIDLAIWVTHEKQIDPEMTIYGLLGFSFPGDDGNLEGLIVDQFWVAQLGVAYYFSSGIVGTMQFDLHSEIIEDSELKAFGDSVQIQLGLGFLELIDNHRLDLFFSEDIMVGSAPDISFGARLIQEF